MKLSDQIKIPFCPIHKFNTGRIIIVGICYTGGWSVPYTVNPAQPNLLWINFCVLERQMFGLYRIHCTVKPVHAVTSIKQSPVLKDHLIFVLS